jgi:hypothetical protein
LEHGRRRKSWSRLNSAKEKESIILKLPNTLWLTNSRPTPRLSPSSSWKNVSFAFRNNLISFCKKIKLFFSISALKDEKATEREQLMLAAYLNQAMCCLKLNDFCATRDHCHKALEMDPKNEKGLFRMGQVTYKLTSNLI